MSVVYYYAKKSNTLNYLKYGLRLSKNFDKEVNLNGYSKPCFSALLNPKDDISKFDSEEYDCLKLEMNNDYCKVIDTSFLIENAKSVSYIDLDKYIFGTFKNPEVLITTSIVPEKISLLNKVIDIPVLFDNSRDLFYQCRIAEMLDTLSHKEAYTALSSYMQKKENE
jgi:hypothetical protein